MENSDHIGTRVSRRRFVIWLGGATGLAALGGCSFTRSSNRSSAQTRTPADRGELQTVTRTSKALGSDVSMTVLHHDRNRAAAAIEAAFGELQTVDEVMSIYRPGSQVWQLNAAGAIENPHPYLVEVLREAQDVARASGGAFDVTVQPLWDVYAAANKMAKLPATVDVAAAMAKIDWKKVVVSDRRIALGEPGMAVTLNGIAQGYAADRAVAALKAHGIEQALVNTGELGALGQRADGQVWQVGIQHPREADAYVALAKLDGRCMATSGDYATSFSADRAYNHIFDPATGRSPMEFSSVTIVTEKGIDADALSTTVFVLGVEKGMELIRATTGTEALFVRKDGRVVMTDGFPRA